MKHLFSVRFIGCLLTAAGALQFVPACSAASFGVKPAGARTDTKVVRPTGAETIVSPVSAANGTTLEELGTQWWKWALTLPVDLSNPYITFDCNSQGKTQSGAVWFLFGMGGPTAPPSAVTLYCAIPAGQTLFFPVINAECSDVEGPPYHGGTADERRACAKAWNDDVRDMTATIDGVAVPNLTSYRAATPDFEIKLPEDNIFGLPKGSRVNSSGDGFYLRLDPLPPGQHEIHFTATAFLGGAPAFSTDTTWILWVAKK